LVPLADMINTAPQKQLNTDCHTNKASTHFECFTTTSIAAGQFLKAVYGTDYSNAQILLDYGFILSKNLHNVVSVALAHLPNTDTTIGRLQDTLLDMFGLRRLSHFQLHRLALTESVAVSTFPIEVLTYARIMTLNKSLLKAFQKEAVSIEHITSLFRQNRALTVLHENRAVRYIIRLLQHRIRSYATSIQEDEHILSEIESNCNGDQVECDRALTLRNIVSLRLDEKSILDNLLKAFRSYGLSLQDHRTHNHHPTPSLTQPSNTKSSTQPEIKKKRKRFNNKRKDEL